LFATTALLSVYQGLNTQIAVLDRQLLRHRREHVAARLLMTIPGVGPLTAIAYIAEI
jgi:error-prone DNA polymerase